MPDQNELNRLLNRAALEGMRLDDNLVRVVPGDIPDQNEDIHRIPDVEISCSVKVDKCPFIPIEKGDKVVCYDVRDLSDLGLRDGLIYTCKDVKGFTITLEEVPDVSFITSRFISLKSFDKGLKVRERRAKVKYKNSTYYIIKVDAENYLYYISTNSHEDEKNCIRVRIYDSKVRVSCPGFIKGDKVSFDIDIRQFNPKKTLGGYSINNLRVNFSMLESLIQKNKSDILKVASVSPGFLRLKGSNINLPKSLFKVVKFSKDKYKPKKGDTICVEEKGMNKGEGVIEEITTTSSLILYGVRLPDGSLKFVDSSNCKLIKKKEDEKEVQ